MGAGNATAARTPPTADEIGRAVATALQSSPLTIDPNVITVLIPAINPQTQPVTTRRRGKPSTTQREHLRHLAHTPSDKHRLTR